MIKYYCDICGDEITRQNQKEVITAEKQGKYSTTGRPNLKVTLTTDSEGDFCMYCLTRYNLQMTGRGAPDDQIHPSS